MSTDQVRHRKLHLFFAAVANKPKGDDGLIPEKKEKQRKGEEVSAHHALYKSVRKSNKKFEM